MKAFGRELNARPALVSTAALLAVLVGTQAAVLMMGRRDATAQLEASAKGVAVSVAHTLALDQEGYREFTRTKDTGGAYYEKMHHLLEAIRDEAGGIRFIETERRLDADTTEFLLDSEPDGSRDHVLPGETNRNDPMKDRVFTSGACATYGSSAQTVSKRGRMIEAYAPILADDGTVLGAVGVDIERSHLLRQFRRTVVTLAAADLLFACLFMAAALFFSDAAMRYLFAGGGGAAAPAALAGRGADGIPQWAGHRQGFALIVLEMDGMKRVNDAYGRRFGDRAAAAVSEVIRGSIRPDDSFVRNGKKGFAVILSDPAPRSAVDVAERIRQGIENAPIFNDDKNMYVKMTVSIGVAIGDGTSQSADDLVEGAEKALGLSKAKGNAVSVFGLREGGLPA